MTEISLSDGAEYSEHILSESFSVRWLLRPLFGKQPFQASIGGITARSAASLERGAPNEERAPASLQTGDNGGSRISVGALNYRRLRRIPRFWTESTV